MGSRDGKTEVSGQPGQKLDETLSQNTNQAWLCTSVIIAK
jgi:hypothetical protein